MGNKWDKLNEKLKDMNSKWDKLNKELDDALEEEFDSEETKPKDIFENAKLVLREHLIANKEEVVKDLEQMREWSNTNKQETLEEAAERLCPNSSWKHGFIEGAKWQAERMYSEKIDLINWLQQSLTAKKFYSTDAEDLLEQFKKK
jgi:hypothetical protein